MEKSEKRQIHHSQQGVSTGGYSAGVVLDGWLYVSGQGSLDLMTGDVVKGSIEEQTRLTMKHVGDVLQGAGCTFDDVVKCTCYITEIDAFDRFDRTYSEFFSGVRPARTTIQAVLSEGLKVEIDAIARCRTL